MKYNKYGNVSIRVLVIFIAILCIITSITLFHNLDTLHSKSHIISEPNYYGLALMGLIPANQEDIHEYWEGDKETGVVAFDMYGNEYHLIEDAFGRTFFR